MCYSNHNIMIDSLIFGSDIKKYAHSYDVRLKLVLDNVMPSTSKWQSKVTSVMVNNNT